MLYFSYGSNMSHRRLQRRTPSARFIATARLHSHALRFHKAGRDGSGKCDAFHTGTPADFVLGAVFQLTMDEKPLLDAHEGLGRGYQSKVVLLHSETHDPLEAFTYYATTIDTSLHPFHWYREHVLRGCRDNDLPADYVEMVELVSAMPDPDLAREAYELAIYR